MVTRHRVLFVDQADFLGGAERVLAEVLGRMDPLRFECMIATNPSSPLLDLLKKRGLGQVKVFETPMPRISKPGLVPILRMWGAVKALRRIAREMQIDLIVTNTVRSHVIGALASKRTRAKLVWYLHDDTFPRPVFRALRYRAALLICVSNYLVDYYGLLQGHVVIHNGIDVSDYQLVEHGVDDHAVVLNAGRLVRWKGQDIFIRAAAKVARSFNMAQFLIVGGSGSGIGRSGMMGGGVDYADELADLVREHGMEERIRFLGEVNNLADLLQTAQLLVHTSTRPEPFGLVILEGMAAGLPVIASDEGGPREIVQDGVTGLLVETGNVEKLARAITKLLASPELRQGMGAAGRERAKQVFDLDRQIRRLEVAVGSLVDSDETSP